jgi:hypothetical protein
MRQRIEHQYTHKNTPRFFTQLVTFAEYLFALYHKLTLFCGFGIRQFGPFFVCHKIFQALLTLKMIYDMLNELVLELGGLKWL